MTIAKIEDGYVLKFKTTPRHREEKAWYWLIMQFVIMVSCALYGITRWKSRSLVVPAIVVGLYAIDIIGGVGIIAWAAYV